MPIAAVNPGWGGLSFHERLPPASYSARRRYYLPLAAFSYRGLWRKSKCLNRQEFVVVRWTDPEGSRPHLGRSCSVTMTITAS